MSTTGVHTGDCEDPVTMCTYQTFKLAVAGSAKGTPAWFRVTEASVYYDHPVHAVDEHTLNIDLRNPERGPSARIAVELTAQAAYDLAQAILTALESVPEGLLPAGLLRTTHEDIAGLTS